MAMPLCEEELGERSVLHLALRLAACPRLLRITSQAHMPAQMAQRVPRAVVVMPTWTELPQPILGRIKRGHIGVRHPRGPWGALCLGRCPVRPSRGIAQCCVRHNL